jgi:ferritin-like metal-binding protein YciE
MSTTSAPTINTYISDMLSLEQHIAGPLEQQVNDSDVQALPAAIRVVREALDVVHRHIGKLEARLDAVGGHGGAGVKNAVSTAVGAAASAVNKVRKTEVSKSLRDDYTALCLASAGYTMLHTTALGMGDEKTAALAQENLTEVAATIMKVNKALPVVVLSELRAEGVAVSTAVAAAAERDSEGAWSEAGSKAGSAN